MLNNSWFYAEVADWQGGVRRGIGNIRRWLLHFDPYLLRRAKLGSSFRVCGLKGPEHLEA